HHCVNAFEGLVVAKTRLEIDGSGSSSSGSALRSQVLCVLRNEPDDVTFCRFSAERHAAVEPYGDFRRTVVLQVAAKTRPNLDDNLEVAATHPSVQFIAGEDWWSFIKVAPHTSACVYGTMVQLDFDAHTKTMEFHAGGARVRHRPRSVERRANSLPCCTCNLFA